MADKRQRLRDIIAAKSLLSGSFTLASGKPSGYFFDMKKTMFDPEGASLVGELLCDLLAGDSETKAVGGLEMGAVPIAAAASAVSALTDSPVHAFFVRKQPKEHGAKLLIEGLMKGESLEGKRVAVIEDVTTTGGSAMKAVEAAKDAGAEVALVFTMVDRQEGATENFQQAGIKFVSLFTADEFLRGS